jgi:prevent-host-death family protein
MKTVGVRELKANVSKILRHVREEGQTYEVTYRGRVVARVVPVGVSPPEPLAERFWDEWRKVADEIGGAWPEGVSALDAVIDDRREL